MKKLQLRTYVHSIFFKVTSIYGVVLLLTGFWSCYISYAKEHNAIVHRFEKTMSQIDTQYNHITEDFWRLYMPIFENPSSIYASLRNYCKLSPGVDLRPMEKLELTYALRAIMANDERIRWVGIFSGENKTGWLLFSGDSTLTEIPYDFPFLEDLENKGAAKEIFKTQVLNIQGKSIRCFVQCGGVAPDIVGGNILVGYNADDLSADELDESLLSGTRFLLLNEKGLIYDSSNLYDLSAEELSDLAQKETGTHLIGSEIVFLQKYKTGTEAYTVLCVASWGHMFFRSLSYTPMIVLVVILFVCFSMVIYVWTGKIIQKKIAKIQYGLKQIGDNQLNYRISVPQEPSDEFDSIASSINDVAGQLQDNIQKAYYSKLKQREAELSELQAKFDPHFLYNTLEVIRGKVYDNGDDETADIIVKLAQIFRSFIGSKIFVPIQEEIDFCNLYLSLLRYRYDDRVRIIYDIDSNILQMGIVRNLLQPILENYFIHGFKSSEKDNWLSIHGYLYEEKYICFQIRDNGVGVPIKRLEEIQSKLNKEKTGSEGSYGLNNIHQRIKLFYGNECGLSISNNKYGGTTISIRILYLSCEEHNKRLAGIEGSEPV